MSSCPSHLSSTHNITGEHESPSTDEEPLNEVLLVLPSTFRLLRPDHLRPVYTPDGLLPHKLSAPDDYANTSEFVNLLGLSSRNTCTQIIDSSSQRRCIQNSFEPSCVYLLFDRLKQTKDFADFPSDYAMALQKLKLAYERTSRERGPLPLPVFFHCIDALGQRQLGMNIKDILREQCEVRIYGPDTTLSVGNKHNFKLHIAAVGHDLFTKQVQLGKGKAKPTTKFGLMKKIAKWVDIYYKERDVSMVGVDARVTSDRLCLVGLTWVSSGAAMALLQIVA